MALSPHEQHVLELIAAQLHAEDPRLASTLDHDAWNATRMRRRLFAAIAFAAGMAMMTTAIFIPHDTAIGGVFTASILGYLVMFFAALSWFGRPFQRPRPTSFSTADANTNTNR